MIVIGAPAARLDMARDFSATHLEPLEGATAAERTATLRELAEGRGPDAVLEFTGHPAAFNEGLNMVRRGGRYVTVGQLGESAVSFAPSVIVRKGLRVIGSLSGGARSYWRAMRFAADHRDTIPFERMITGRYKLDEVGVALDRMRRMEEIKPLIAFD